MRKFPVFEHYILYRRCRRMFWRCSKYLNYKMSKQKKKKLHTERTNTEWQTKDMKVRTTWKHASTLNRSLYWNCSIHNCSWCLTLLCVSVCAIQWKKVGGLYFSRHIQINATPFFNAVFTFISVRVFCFSFNPSFECVQSRYCVIFISVSR